MKNEWIFKIAQFGMTALLFSLFITLSRKKAIKRENANFYRFNLPEWNDLNGENELKEIEKDFQTEFVAKALNLKALYIRDLHSNLKHKTLPYKTGMIKMHNESGSHLAMIYGVQYFGFLRAIAGSALNRTAEYRYFSGELNFVTKEIVHMNSRLQPRIKETGMEEFSEDFKKFDEVLGIDKWQFIMSENKVYVLTAEMFEEARVKQFLEMCQALTAKL